MYRRPGAIPNVRNSMSVLLCFYHGCIETLHWLGSLLASNWSPRLLDHYLVLPDEIFVQLLFLPDKVLCQMCYRLSIT
jgi:hypothetical protein